MTVAHECEACAARVEAPDLEGFLDRYVEHVAASHPDWGYSDKAVRAYAKRWFAVPRQGPRSSPG